MANNDCLFCKIIKGEIPSKVRYQDENWFVFDDINPIAPKHVLLVPKKHFTTLEEVATEDRDFHANLLLTARKIASEIGINQNYKFFMNVGEKVQAIPHVHLHIYGGWDTKKTTKELDQESLDLINS